MLALSHDAWYPMNANTLSLQVIIPSIGEFMILSMSNYYVKDSLQGLVQNSIQLLDKLNSMLQKFLWGWEDFDDWSILE